MQTTQSSAHYFVETPLKAKIRKASASVPRHMQWRLYIFSLVLLDIVMLGVMTIRVGEFPDNGSVPRDLLDDATLASLAIMGVVGIVACAQQVSVVEELDAEGRRVAAFPDVDNLALHVDQECAGRSER